ncbi:hypothetical protein PHSY_001060 [Pseudozyma hubeiensis SY62]|uniref:Uncharacterized protein n=1 Tax=Pseudozyma hubeiensis (strain SY62) TaxID=1305764 RepID=R9P5W6_PSEHS|nr:hypothetical protein PHSY_001060 [Pseudozyma hubeiensis SY62]GAC93495.1 hypothetical protein PHSY_001060 [Pseudozyma hubeiensis SY62]
MRIREAKRVSGEAVKELAKGLSMSGCYGRGSPRISSKDAESRAVAVHMKDDGGIPAAVRASRRRQEGMSKDETKLTMCFGDTERQTVRWPAELRTADKHNAGPGKGRIESRQVASST